MPEITGVFGRQIRHLDLAPSSPQKDQEREILNYLTPELQRVYNSIPRELTGRYEIGLDSILRGQAENHWPFNRHFQETDWMHTLDMVKMISGIRARFPNLTTEIDLNEATIQAYIHDGGEIYVGDVPARGPQRESADGQRRKRLEPICVTRCLIPQIPNPSLKNRISRSYNRFMFQDPNDKEAVFVRLMDKAQGTTAAGARFLFGRYKYEGFSEPTEGLNEHVTITLKTMMETATHLKSIISPASQRELSVFVNEELTVLQDLGYFDQVRGAKFFYDNFYILPSSQ